MKDQYGRTIDYLRISVTDRCNFRCRYCMPQEGVEFISHDRIMTYEEILRVCRIFAGLGISRIKITGGEPLVRKEVCGLMERIRGLEGISSVTLTTNGSLLSRYLPQLKQAGVDCINVSLDTLDRVRFAGMTGQDCLLQVMEGIRETIEAGIPVKINCIPIRGFNREELGDLAAFAREAAVQVRFIEMMPVGLGSGFDGMGQEEVRQLLESRYGPLVPVEKPLGNGPARYYRPEGFQGNIGFISAVSHQFCGECNRVRLTSDGILKPCLSYESHMDVKQAMRDGAGDRELADMIREGIYRKPARHGFGDEENRAMRETRRMAAIGG